MTSTMMSTSGPSRSSNRSVHVTDGRHPVDALARDVPVADVGQRERCRRGEDQPGDGLADRAETEEGDVHAAIIRAASGRGSAL